MKRISALILLSAASAHAAVLAATDFDSTTKSGSSQVMSDIVWTGDDLLNVTPNPSVATVASANAGYFTTEGSGYGETSFAPKQNTINQGPWSATFELTFNGEANGTLSSVSFDYQGLTGTGALHSPTFIWPHDATVEVNGGIFEAIQAFPDGSSSGTLTFTDTANLVNGPNTIVITVSSDSPSGGYNMAIDNLSFNGTVVPEPGSLLLLGLGGLLISARRRR